ncbi:MAG TPA: peptidylprolyl isomerase [Phnomibacter sp.]|mgnify:CR=1 FL=1|nr:peptidylprolyl isomerase [Phnomibacter sp.]
MSIIQSIREKAAPVVIGVIALSLIGFILMDAGRSGMGGGVSPTDAVGSVNGVNISYQEFLEKTKAMEQMYEMQGRPMDENSRQQVYADTWRQMTEAELMNQEMAKLGITVTNKEFDDMLFGKNPAEFLKQEFTDPNTGEFNAAAARQALSQLKKADKNPNKDIVQKFYLDPLLENGMRKKYFNLLQNSVYVPTWMAEKTMADNSQLASFSFVNVPYTSIADSLVKVSDGEILEYAKKYAKEYETKENSRSIAYVAFPFTATAQDSSNAYNALINLKEDFKSSGDAAAFVTRNASTLEFFDGYNSASRIQIPVKDSILGAGKDNVYGPYLDGNNYVMSRIVDVKTLPDSAKVRHILIAVASAQNPQGRDDSSASKLADSLLAVVKAGGNWTTLAAQFSDDPGSKEKGGVYDFFPTGQMVKEFNDFSFEKPKGEKGVVRTNFGYHVIEVLDQKNFAPAYKIAYMARAIEPSQNTINDALNKANMFAGSSRSLKAFDENATKNQYNKLVGAEIKENDFQIMGLGSNRRLIKDIFAADVGDVLEPEQIGDQFVVVAITGEEKKGLPSVAKLRPMVESMVRNKLKFKQIKGKLGNVVSLDAAAQTMGVTVSRADSISFGSPMIPGAGYELKVGGFAFNKAAINKVSPVIEGSSGVYVVKPESIIAKSDVSGTVDEMKTNMASQAKSSAIYTSLQALKDAAKITDKRSKFM